MSRAARQVATKNGKSKRGRSKADSVRSLVSRIRSRRELIQKRAGVLSDSSALIREDRER